MDWKPISERPEFGKQPIRQFVLLEGSRFHSGAYWARRYWGEAYIMLPGQDAEWLQYRRADIERLARDGDMDPESVEVTYWMPAICPAPYPVERAA